MPDLITADLDAMEAFVDTAKDIQRHIGDLDSNIMYQFKKISDWNDEIRERTLIVLQEIKKKEEVINDLLFNLYRDVDDLIDDLDIYLNNANNIY